MDKCVTCGKNTGPCPSGEIECWCIEVLNCHGHQPPDAGERYEKHLRDNLGWKPTPVEEKAGWEGKFWQLVEKEGIGSDVRFCQHVRDLIREEKAASFREGMEAAQQRYEEKK